MVLDSSKTYLFLNVIAMSVHCEIWMLKVAFILALKCEVFCISNFDINIPWILIHILSKLYIGQRCFGSSQSAKLIAQQNNFEEGVGDTLNQIRQENQYRISEIVRSLSQQRTDFENQISFLKSTQQDFSLIIEDAIKKVVTVTP